MRESERRRSRSRSKSRSRSRSRHRRSREVSTRTYRAPTQDHYDPPRRGSVPQKLYIAKNSPDSGLTDEGPDKLESYRRSDVQRFQPYDENSSRHRDYYDEADASAYRLAENPYHGDVHPLSPVHRKNLKKWYERKFPVMSKSPTSEPTASYTRTLSDGSHTRTYDDQTLQTYDEQTLQTNDDTLADDQTRRMREAEGDFVRTKQSVAYFSILLTSVQLLVLMLQIFMCGMAPMDVNGFVGPYPDAFSEWGGKNAYLILYNNEWWRLVSPSLLHVGIIHLLVNAFCQLEAIAFFEREWGSFRWILVYLISSVGCNAFSAFFDPDTIAVGSSGALMGMYGAKLAQVVTVSCFDLQSRKYDDMVRMDHLSSVLCGMTVVFILTAFAYIDWSGHMGGMLCGFLTGMVFFSNPIESCCAWFIWVSWGLLSLIASLASVLYFFITTSEPDEDIADACEYFRSFFPEDYDCNCFWQY